MVAVRRRSDAITAPRYTRDDVVKQSEASNEPQWLRDARIESWNIYEAIEMPHLEEEWRRTDYRSIRWQEADVLISPNGATAQVVPSKNMEPLIGDHQGGLIVIVDGKVVHHELAAELVAQNVIFTDLATAVQQHGDLVQQYLGTAVKAQDGKFAALHNALWSYGVFVYIPRNKAIELPLHVVIFNTKVGASLGHNLIVLDENSQATIQVDYASHDSQQHSSYIGATELVVGAAANLRYVSLQEWNRSTYEFSHQRALVGRDGQLDWVLGTMGGRLIKAFVEVDINGSGANARVSGFFFADENQFFDLDTQQNHNAPLTTSDLLFKGAAKDEARTLWQGMIKSLPKMQKIDGYQVCRNLVLSDDARMDGIPGLEIEADDVACSHAATFGTLEDQPIFYLMSRGIKRSQAELMLIEGFFDELLERIPFDRVKQRLVEEIEAKIIG